MLLLGLALSACSRGAPPAPLAEEPIAPQLARLRCAAPSSLGRSNRTEACRLLADFEAGAAFTQLPAPGAEQVWVGVNYQGQPNQESDVVSFAAFVVLHLQHGQADAATVRNYQLAPSHVLPVVASDLVLTRFANPSASAGGLERAREEFQRLRGLVDALAAGQPANPEVGAWVRGLREDETSHFPMRGPVAVSRSAGRSLVLRGQLPSAAGSTGWNLRMAADGRRALLQEGSSVVELWRLP